MLERIQLTNFQRHALLRIVFDPGITTIVGPTDAGKSSVLRAIWWWFTNRPRGDDFRRWDTTRTTVRGWIDGHNVARVRSNDLNAYILDGEQLKAIGADVPGPVADVFDISELNFQSQHDAVFWFSESAPAVGKRLNAIVNLGAIDDTLAKIGAADRRARAEQRVAADRVNAARAARTILAHVPKMVKAADRVDALHRQAGERNRLASILGDLVAKGVEHAATVRNAAETTRRGETAVSAYRVAGRAARDAKRLRLIVHEAVSATDRVDAVVPDMATVDAAYKRARDARTDAAALADLLASIDDATDRHAQTEDALCRAEERLAAAPSPKVCPTCGRAM